MLLAIFILSLVVAGTYNYLTVPALCAEVARRKGLDERKWYFNGLVLSGVALLYLRSILSSSEADLKKRIDGVLILGTLFIIWMIGLGLLLEASGY
ncbi:MAG: hypothetical protein ACE5Q6_20185 [Dehalococcoidia bacterium]